MSRFAAIRPAWIMIHDCPQERRADFDVTSYQYPDGRTLTISKYGDHIWDFSRHIQRSNGARSDGFLNFDFVLPDGKSLIDPTHHRLLHSAKEYFYARWMHKSPVSKKFVSASTVISDWTPFRALLKWMVTREFSSLRQLPPSVCVAYVADVKADMREHGWGLGTAITKIEILHLLYLYREYLADPPPRHPWPESTSQMLMGRTRLRDHYQAMTEIIPDRLYIKLGRSALDYLTEAAPNLLTAYDEFQSIRERAMDAVNASKQYRRDGSRHRLSATGIPAIEAAVTSRIRGRFPLIAQKYGFSDLKHFWSELEFARTCCYVACAMFSGMRDSELCSLKMGAFSRSQGFDNEEYCWLSGTTYKLEIDPRPARWMVPDAVEQAVNVASRLAAPINELIEVELDQLRSIPMEGIEEFDRARANRILELNRLRRNLFADWTGPLMRARPLDNATSNQRLKELSERFGLIIAPEDMAGIRDRKKIVAGATWPLATHQFRRTFAVFVARNMLGDVRYLRHHFKHWSIDMTLYYASDPLFDDSLLETTLTTRDELQATVLSDWLTGEKPLTGGRSGYILQFRQRDKPKTVKGPTEVAKSLGDGVFIRGTGHSWCLATTAGCGGEGLYDAIRCVNCRESVIDQSHIGIWREIRRQQIETLSWPELGQPVVKRALDHIQAAEQVLADLGERVEPYQSEGAGDAGKD
jgi:integrase